MNGEASAMNSYLALPSSQERLANAAEELSRAETLDSIMEVVRLAARHLIGADGATFVLKDGSQCFYADEDAIGPLWKGRRFPQTTCISGWVMMYGKPAIIENIFDDPRIPLEAYRPTIVRSLAMVPVREHAPIAAIGNYWSRPHRASAEQIRLLQELATYTAEAMARTKRV